MNLYDKHPTLAVDAFIAPSASVIGDVKVADKSSVWYNCVLRGDINYIRVGAYTNIQDRTVLLTSKDNPNGLGAGVEVGDFVTVGQGSLLHACKIESSTMLGMGTVVGEGCVVQENCITAPGTVLPPGTLVPAGEYWAGNPAKFVRKIDTDEKTYIQASAEKYYANTEKHMAEFLPFGTGYIEVEKLEKA
jgi:carbonic anhydrase/acetyltransferase-like protein (isoleucine patch superfamily)